ncbi:MAG: ATP-binding cassette domain-containing protein, partial [Deltaproteobacteria bacterium]|nr:ATP-binding cassette domain-containing protein [Deltaproteobacteria bacterium]
MAWLELADVTVALGGRDVVRASCEVSAGQLVVIVGPNGAGKTTLLRVLAGLVTQRQGRV